MSKMPGLVRWRPRRAPRLVKFKRAKSVFKVDKKVNRLSKRLSRDQELKYVVQGNNNLTMVTDVQSTISGSAISLFQIPQSSGASTTKTRIGDKVTITSLTVRINIRPEAMSALDIQVQNQIFRVIIFMAKYQPAVATIPSIADVLEPVSGAFANTCPYNPLAFPDRYKILYDRVYSISSALGPMARILKIKKKMNRNMKFNGIAGTYDQQLTGSCYLYIVTERDTSGADHMRYDYTSIVRFKDD